MVFSEIHKGIDLRSLDLASGHTETVVIALKNGRTTCLAESCYIDDATLYARCVGSVLIVDGVVDILLISSVAGIVDTVAFT